MTKEMRRSLMRIRLIALAIGKAGPDCVILPSEMALVMMKEAELWRASRRVRFQQDKRLRKNLPRIVGFAFVAMKTMRALSSAANSLRTKGVDSPERSSA